MKKWEFQKPSDSKLLDHDVPILSSHLTNKRIALLVSGGIAAMYTPMIARSLRRHGAQVYAYCSDEALKYVAVDALEWATNNPVITKLTNRSEHLSKEAPFDLYLLAPATYNTINKIRHGIADTTITTTLAAAIGLLERNETKILVCPTMHGDLHTQILTESMATLEKMGVDFIPPRDDYGKHNIPHASVISAHVIRALSKSKLRNHKVLVTAGPTPAQIDNVRSITNKFKGRLGVEIAKEAFFRGANVNLILGDTAIEVPEYLDVEMINSYDAYKSAVMEKMNVFFPEYCILAAAVADYQPIKKVAGKIPSGGSLESIELKPTEKIVDLITKQFPKTEMISFKYEEKISLEDLFKKARNRILKGHKAVVANRGEDFEATSNHVAYLVSGSEEPIKITGKAEIARAIFDFMEEKASARHDVFSLRPKVTEFIT